MSVRMSIRMSWLAAAALLGGVLAGSPSAASAEELVYGAWMSPREYQNVHVMPEMFKNIEKATNGAIKWKLIPGGAIADGKGTFAAVKDGLMQGGMGIVTYSPNTIPSVYAIYSTVILGHSDVVAATGAALEVMYLRCPSCLQEFKRNNAVPLGGWDSAAYVLACTSPVKSPADLKGKRVRATAGNGELMRAAGGVPVNVTLVDAVGLLQRGGLDCQHGVADWLKTFGYADFTKYVADQPLGITGPAIGFVMNRGTWNKLTPEQKAVHIKQAAWMSAKMAIGNFMIANDETLATLVKEKGVTVLKTDPKDWAGVIAEFQKSDRARNVAKAKSFGVADPGTIIDDYQKTIEAWRGRSKEIGRDIDKFAAVLMRDVFSKIDLTKL
ncbi:MAG TPA: TRAP transporter substrate-binding protein DctP [Hyphomicrobiaceae bacterium]|nr:TRAP transporter substrate-binding protein DctP [Hyphomicrobiaceae bacterium]